MCFCLLGYSGFLRYDETAGLRVCDLNFEQTHMKTKLCGYYPFTVVGEIHSSPHHGHWTSSSFEGRQPQVPQRIQRGNATQAKAKRSRRAIHRRSNEIKIENFLLAFRQIDIDGVKSDCFLSFHLIII